ncbi:MAG: GNAT family N-acetyltransferase [bacterium]
MAKPVEHNPSEKNFSIKLNDEYGYLWYSRKSGALSLDRLFVPPSRRNEGFAEDLTKAAFQYCQRQNLQVIPICPYIKNTFLENHPEYSSLIAEDGGPPEGYEFLRL